MEECAPLSSNGALSPLEGFMSSESLEDWDSGAFSTPITATTVEAEQEKRARAEETIQELQQQLLITKRERDEARDQLHQLLKGLHQIPPTTTLNLTTTSLSAVNPLTSFSDVDPPMGFDLGAAVIEELAMKRPLPEEGRLSEAMAEIMSIPMLSTLLAAGSLPGWRNPPSTLPAIQMPPSHLCESAIGNQSYLMRNRGDSSKRPMGYCCGAAEEEENSMNGNWKRLKLN